MTQSSNAHPLRETVALFLRLGLTAFGGPAAHIGLMRDEVVGRRRWLSDAAFLDLVGATNLIPGPNSTELAIHLGYLRAGWAGLILGGTAFILPAMLIVWGLAWAYVRYGSTPAAGWLLYGVKPVVIAVVVQALWKLGRTALKGRLTLAVGAGALALGFAGWHELLLLLAAGVMVMVAENLRRLRVGAGVSLLVVLTPFAEAQTWLWRVGGGPALTMLAALVAAPFSLPLLFLTFLKIGAVLYGSGYVLLAFLHADFVARLGWLTDRQLLDAVAIGQVTPGPVFTTATFIGYLLGGGPGALLATLGIFLPSFVFVALSHPLIPRLRNSPWFGGFLDGVNVASLALMATVTWQLGRASIVDPLTAALAAGSALLLFRYGLNTTWLIAAGAAAGGLRLLLAGV